LLIFLWILWKRLLLRKEIVLNPIYFAYDKSNITKEGAAELDKLVYVMSKNEDLVIFVKSHTDSNGVINTTLIFPIEELSRL
jgi:outer membrane protein OmpA-like peptidoglycan-associated protein